MAAENVAALSPRNEEIESDVRSSTPIHGKSRSNISKSTSLIEDGKVEDIEDSDVPDDESEVSGRSSSQSKRRGPKKRSPIWNYFGWKGEGKNVLTYCILKKTDGKIVSTPTKEEILLI